MPLKTLMVRYDLEQLGWRAAVTAAAGLSLASMLSMEVVDNIVDYHLMAGMVNFADPKFWAAARNLFLCWIPCTPPL
jgi:hypothetical protein